MSRVLILQILLAALVFASAVGVVVARHEARQVFIEHQAALSERDALNLEWTQLQLEQATWATQARIETAARERLGMIKPGPEHIVYVGEASWER
ncbi:cell division protein FtsL [Thioalkalivibrio paradoxus]|uniref:Cell division protein FtsL n=1 Tax=Thioalkalivibrio paradoxus ARh 1 TaxID=713585 RepID=W0DPX1_9GAMM|nr:cell division protein FtsL [Thioalkalivibrio paradoxus]AHE99282.1 cell division protein FtsL [Thioalkalivibrio paradoxus ARh 1]